MKRWMNILEFTVLLMKRYWRSTIGLLAVYSFIVFAFGSVLMLIQSIASEANIVLSSAPELSVQRIIGGRLVLIDDDAANTIAGIRGVSRAQGRLWGYYSDAGTGGVFTIIGSDSFPKGTAIMAGRSLNASDTGGVVVCGTGYLELQQTSVGSQIVLRGADQELHTLRVVGAFTSPSDLLTRDLLVVSRKDARQLLGIKNGLSTDIAVEVANPDEVETIAKKITQRIKNARVVTRNQLLATYQALFGYRGSLFQFGLLMSLFAFMILAWQKAGGLSPAERKEIGIQKAVGWSIPDIMLQKFWEGSIISFNATLLGLIAAYIHVFYLDAPLLKPFLAGWSVVYPRFHLVPHFELGSLILVVCFSVVPYLGATIVPSWRVAISDPSEVMHAS
jgi:hypothetical protein